MEYANNYIFEFMSMLASRSAVPGGGGASAMAGALGAALASMVANLTTGKKKYAAYEEKIQEILGEASALRLSFMALADKDAKAFEPLSKAYAIPKNEPGREERMEQALFDAAQPPLEIMLACCKAIELLEALLECGSAIAISDVGVGAALCAAALKGASYNVYVNTGSMSDSARAGELEKQAQDMLEEYLPRAERVTEAVEQRIKKER